MQRSYSIRKMLALLAVAVYAVSLVLPAVAAPNGKPAPGWLLLLYGPVGIGDFGEPRWLANPLLWATAISLFATDRRTVLTVLTAVAGACLALSCLIFPVTWVEGGGPGAISEVKARLLSGAYLWITAQVIALVSALCAPRSAVALPARNA
jgi:hypothetical protein